MDDEAADGDKLRIMLVEDEFLVRASLVETLSDEGYDVVEATSGEEAIDAIASMDGLALLMTDMQLSGAADGRAVVRAARSRHPDLPVIYMTGRPDMIDAGDRPRETVVAKPYLLSEMAAHVRRMLAG